MKVVILAGGYGTRISEESTLRPKPMVEIGGMPILWHIMKYYSSYGYNDFVICLGYKGYMIKEFFANYCLHVSDVTFDLAHNSMELHNNQSESWKVTLANTGQDTLTGGRIKRIAPYIGNEPFMMTYGDGLCNVDLPALLSHHRSNHHIVTLTAIQPEGRFGTLDIGQNDRVESFQEKQRMQSGWINGGFMVMQPEIFGYIAGDHISLEQEPLEQIAAEGKLGAYRHAGFWQCMDTMREKILLEELWEKTDTPWQRW